MTRTTILLGIMVAFAICVTAPAYANHGTGSGSWLDGSVTYHCMDTLDDLSTTSNVYPCSDIAEAVKAWNDVDSSFELSKVQSNGESMYGAKNLASQIRGINSNTVSNSGGATMTYADISFNTDHMWADRVGNDWWKVWLCYDFISVATHESGHTIRLTHDSASTLMKSSHSCGEVYRTLSNHDEAAVEAKYP
ncbi:MAG: matrixin family metalloprotease [Thaumarchaeota archaeon]|nr:matrixin family metalloprotease [Nitrososphaerota archaeon]